MLERGLLAEATVEAARQGFARRSNALGAEAVSALLDEASLLGFESLEPVVGRVRQSGMVSRQRPFDPALPHLNSLAACVQEGVRRSGLPGAEWFAPNEAMYQSYLGEADGITAHRDQSFYRFAVVIFNLEGEALFRIIDRVSSEGVEEWPTRAGDMYVLAGGGLVERDIRPMHEVGAPKGARRVSLTLRMKQRSGA